MNGYVQYLSTAFIHNPFSIIFISVEHFDKIWRIKASGKERERERGSCLNWKDSLYVLINTISQHRLK